jgi:transposase-like protein
MIKCPHCESTQTCKMGKSSSGNQRYLCRNESCTAKTFSAIYELKGAHPQVQKQAVEMSINGSGIRDTTRVLKINRNTVMAHIKKKKANF